MWPLTQLDDPQARIESVHAANMAPCSAMLVKLDISCDAIESQSRGAGARIVARIPTVGLLSTGFVVVGSWAPFQPHVCLLHERSIAALNMQLIDSDTLELIELTDKRGWSSISESIMCIHPAPSPSLLSTVRLVYDFLVPRQRA